MKALLCKYILLSMWLAVHMTYGATASAVSFTASEPDENGSVQLAWVVTGPSYAGGIRFNVAVSRSETNDLMTSTIIAGAYMDQRNSVRGSLVDTPPIAGKTYYYWFNCAPYNSSYYNNFAYLWLNEEYDRIHNSSPYGPITVHIPAAEDQRFKVMFNSNDGSGVVSEQEFEKGVSQKLTKNGFHRSGYVFQGWAMTATGDVQYKDEAEITADSEMTLFAVWEAYKISIEVAAADWSEGSITIRCTDEDKSEEDHKYTLCYKDGEDWIDVDMATDVSGGVYGSVYGMIELKDDEFSKRLGGITTVKYKVKDETGRESNEVETRRRYALCVGINVYYAPQDPSDKSQDLSECVADANGWRQKLEALGGFSSEVALDANATKSRILSSLVAYAQSVEPGDIFVYTHSGHGDEGALSTHNLFEEITAWEFASALSSFPSGTGIVVILDTCYSGSMVNRWITLANATKTVLAGKSASRSFAQSVIAAMNSMDVSAKKSAAASPSRTRSVSRGGAVGWITAADSDELSTDGVFSQMCLLTAGWEHGRADSDGDGQVSFYELGDFAVDYLDNVFLDFEMTPQVISADILRNVCAGEIPGHATYSPIIEAPVNVEVSAEYSHQITISWSRVPNAKFYYVICLPRQGIDDTEEVQEVILRRPDDAETFITLTTVKIYKEVENEYGELTWKKLSRALKPGDSFDIWVRAYNPMYAGPASEEKIGRAITHVGPPEPSMPASPLLTEFVLTNFGDIAGAQSSPLNTDGTINYENLSVDHDGDGLSSLQECVAGSNPRDKASTFSTQIKMKGRIPEITWTPRLSPEAEAKRKYVILGRKNLSDGSRSVSEWVDMESVKEDEANQYHFFKVMVDFR